MPLDSLGLWELIDRRAEATPDAEMAVDEQGTRLTFGAFRRRCEEVAAWLHTEHGVGPDDRVSWQLPTWIDAMVLMGALVRLGAVQNPILHIYRRREVGFVMNQAEPGLFLVPPEWGGFGFAAMAEELTDGLDTEVLVVERDGLPTDDPATLPPPPPVPDDAADLPVRWLYYTSGTTSDPKGATHSDASLRAAGIGMSEGLDLQEDDRFALVFPITHIAGGVYLYSALAYGTAFIFDPAFDPSTTIPLLRREGVTQAGAGTVFHQMYLRAQRARDDDDPLFPEVRTFPGGGAPKPPQLHYDLKEEIGGAGIVAGYGLTEAPILTMASVDDPDEVLAHTEGSPVPGVSLRIVDLDGAAVGPGEVGEVRAKGPQITRGYLDPSLDGEAFDDDGWFRTGDLGHLDADDNLTITGRLKDVIIRKGETISAKEIEDELHAHPAIADVAVVGLPDEERGELVCAVVVTEEGAEPVSLENVTAHLTDAGLMRRKLPERVEHVDALPRNPTGKILKYELRERFVS